MEGLDVNCTLNLRSRIKTCSADLYERPYNKDEVDCSQSPYFFVGFSRPVRFYGTAAILVCKIERDLGRVSKLPRGAGVGVSIVREGK